MDCERETGRGTDHRVACTAPRDPPIASASSKPALVSASRSTRPASPLLCAFALDGVGHPRMRSIAQDTSAAPWHWRPQHHLLRGAGAGGIGEVEAVLDRHGGARRRQAPMLSVPEHQFGRLGRRPDARLGVRDADGSGWRRARPRKSAATPLAGPSRSEPSSRVPAASSFNVRVCTRPQRPT